MLMLWPVDIDTGVLSPLDKVGKLLIAERGSVGEVNDLRIRTADDAREDLEGLRMGWKSLWFALAW